MFFAVRRRAAIRDRKRRGLWGISAVRMPLRGGGGRPLWHPTARGALLGSAPSASLCADLFVLPDPTIRVGLGKQPGLEVPFRPRSGL